MQERKIIVYSEDEYDEGKYRRSVRRYDADTVLVKLRGTESTYKVIKSRYHQHGRIIRMEVL